MNLTMNDKSKNLKWLFAIMVTVITLLAPLGFSTHEASASLRTGVGGGTFEGAQGKLRQSVDDAISNKSYISSTGDTIKGSQLVKNGITTDRFNELTAKEKQRLIDDMSNAVLSRQQKDKESGANNPVTDDTVNNWLKELQQQPGVGSKLLSNIMAQIKPDYVSGNRIFEPFSGPINTIIALGAIITLAAVSVTIIADMCYLNIPMFQVFVANSISNKGGSAGSRYTNFFVGRSAIQAVEEAENDSNGKSRNPNGIYLKKQFIGLILLGLCLLYLVQGQIFAIVGMIMDLLGGFLE